MKDTDNRIDGDVGTWIQAGSISEVHLTTPRKLPWRKVVRYLIGPAAVAVALVVATLMASDEAANQPAAATVATSTTAATVPTTSSPSSTVGTPAASTTVGAARPAVASHPPRPSSGTPVAVTPEPTTAKPAPPPASTGVRFSGVLRFGSFHLDLAQPRDVPGTNVWRMPQNRLHGDDNYELAEWLGDTAPGPDECAADLVRRATKDAENLIIGSRVCGKTPAGRIFLIDVVALDDTITGQVTVWD